MIYLYLIAVLSILIGLLYYLFLALNPKKNKIIKEKDIKENPNIAILIPARNESKVIENLLISIENQSAKILSKNVFVIVEDEKDETCKITTKHQMNYFVRKKLNLKTKGYALAELIEDLNTKKEFFDLYFIFDADNVLDKDFIKNMLIDYKKGYAISTGYRALKNYNNYFPVSAGLTFLMINEIRNRNALKKNGNLILSGTGYYINGNLIKKWKTFPFHSLTEDYESSLYYALEGISTHYQNKAIFYDEQPENYKKSITQRSRWIKGYLQNWLKYRPEIKKKIKEKNTINKKSLIEMYIGITPALYIVFGLLFLTILVLFSTGITLSWQLAIYLLFFFGIIYLSLVLLTAILLYNASKQLKLTAKVYFQTLLFHPIFIISYLHAFVVALIKRNLGWDAISHGNFKND